TQRRQPFDLCRIVRRPTPGGGAPFPQHRLCCRTIARVVALIPPRRQGDVLVAAMGVMHEQVEGVAPAAGSAATAQSSLPVAARKRNPILAAVALILEDAGSVRSRLLVRRPPMLAPSLAAVVPVHVAVPLQQVRQPMGAVEALYQRCARIGLSLPPAALLLDR